MQLENEAPFHLVGESISCPDCGKLMIRILANGDFEHNGMVHLQISGDNTEAADGRRIGQIENAICLSCHPQTSIEKLPEDIPQEVRRLLVEMLGGAKATPSEVTDPRIKLPWEERS